MRLSFPRFSAERRRSARIDVALQRAKREAVDTARFLVVADEKTADGEISVIDLVQQLTRGDQDFNGDEESRRQGSQKRVLRTATIFQTNGFTFRMHFVGYSRIRRQKRWLDALEGSIDAVIFALPLTSYCQQVRSREGYVVNRMVASLQEVEAYCAIPVFARTPIIAFFTGRESFEASLATRRIAAQDASFRDFYTPSRDPTTQARHAELYFSRLFLDSTRKELPKRPVFLHTVKNDSTESSLKFLFDTTQTIFRMQNLSQAGLIRDDSTTTASPTDGGSSLEMDLFQTYSDNGEEDTYMSDSNSEE